MLSAYIKQISQIHNRGDATEKSYYSTLESLLKEYADKNLSRNINITTLPKKTEAGNPDFRLWDGKQKIIGYIEAKAPDVTNLDNIETSNQLKRYLTTFPNVILTNFLEFRLYRDGTLTDHVTIARPVILQKLKTELPLEKESEFFELLYKFFHSYFRKSGAQGRLQQNLQREQGFSGMKW